MNKKKNPDVQKITSLKIYLFFPTYNKAWPNKKIKRRINQVCKEFCVNFSFCPRSPTGVMCFYIASDSGSGSAIKSEVSKSVEKSVAPGTVGNSLEYDRMHPGGVELRNLRNLKVRQIVIVIYTVF